MKKQSYANFTATRPSVDMPIDIQFDHVSHLSLTDLQARGIRSTRMLEEVFFDPHTACFEITHITDPDPIFMMVGFSESMLPLLYIFSASEVVVSLYARIAVKDEIRRFFCS